MATLVKVKFIALGFWRKVDTYEEQPDIHFLHQLIMIMETGKFYWLKNSFFIH